MATQEEIIGGIRELEGEIRRLNTEIGGLENKRKLTPTDTSLAVQISEKTALMTAKENRLTAKQNTLTALIKSQQGMFHRTFPLRFANSSRCNPLPNRSTSPLHPFRFGNDER